ncbi:MAG: restriction endonuclease subunit S [Candidatus Omnitrophota bacterium]
MENKTGYKRTEMGLIPDAWGVICFADICDQTIRWSLTGGPSGSGLKTTDYAAEGVRILQLQNIGDGFFHDGYAIYTTEKKADALLSCNIYPGEIILSKMGDPVARACFVPRRDKRYLLASDGIRLVVDEKRFDKQFVHDYINSVYFRRVAQEASTGSTRQRIGLEELRQLPFLVPPLAEQTAIAGALADVGALIQTLKKLIAKKRAVKKGAMEQLLSGRTRLPGFTGEWRTRTFGELFTFLSTANCSRDELTEFGEIGYIHYGDIHTRWSHFLNLSRQTVPRIAKQKVRGISLVENGDLVVADVSEDIRGLGASVEIKNLGNQKIVAGLHTLLLRGNKTLIADGFKCYLREMDEVKRALIRIATGISVYGISKANLKRIGVTLPPLDEQIAIAELLADMDEEIEALERKRAKYIEIRNGMKQELFTGKTRLM